MDWVEIWTAVVALLVFLTGINIVTKGENSSVVGVLGLFIMLVVPFGRVWGLW